MDLTTLRYLYRIYTTGGCHLKLAMYFFYKHANWKNLDKDMGASVATFACEENQQFASSLPLKVSFRFLDLLQYHLCPLCFDSHYHIHDKITGVITIFSE